MPFLLQVQFMFRSFNNNTDNRILIILEKKIETLSPEAYNL